jgi:hypothetical protein
VTKHKILEWEEQKNYKIKSDFSDFIDNYLSSVTLNKNKVKFLIGVVVEVNWFFT